MIEFARNKVAHKASKVCWQLFSAKSVLPFICLDNQILSLSWRAKLEAVSLHDN